MVEIIPNHLLDLLVISATTSVIIMAVIQKIKTLSFITKDWQVWILNLIFSFGIGIPFAILFYGLGLFDSIWVSVFSFVGAPSIYDVLKNQTLINYKPISLSDKIIVEKKNKIERG